jgi:hypothetical protein
MKTIIHAIESFRKEHVSLLGLRPDPTFLVAMLLIFFASSLAFAGSGTWLSSPVSGDWNTPANWSSTTVPNGPADTATFGSSSISAVSISADTEVNGIVFTPHAQPTPFDITVTNSAFFNPPRTLTLSGAGITNNSGVIQNFFVARMPFGEGATIVFENQATAGEMTAFTGFGNSSAPPFLVFNASSTAGGATINNNSSITEFNAMSNAANATINNSAGGSLSGSLLGGGLDFNDNSSAGSATINNATPTFNQGGILAQEPASLSFTTIRPRAVPRSLRTALSTSLRTSLTVPALLRLRIPRRLEMPP